MRDRARCWIAVLLIWALPLQAISAAMQRTAMPAHFHIHALHGSVVTHPTHADDVIGYLDAADHGGQAHTGVEQHHHALGEVGVVYVADDGDGVPGTGTGTGKHVFAFDLLLPSWTMPALPMLACVAPSSMTIAYASRCGDRLDRPPC